MQLERIICSSTIQCLHLVTGAATAKSFITSGIAGNLHLEIEARTMLEKCNSSETYGKERVNDAELIFQRENNFCMPI